ncbi:hypothetical protein B5807_07931 [Epicoccum nigrum]|uniref:Cytochrome P450 n=1 Tax=Epicoccum nigrum TaxID=105696 RepID=A0A1Y2LXD4_EPING|nr:hypothetical protein B5807_07931 [Epicoccum nigrum]
MEFASELPRKIMGVTPVHVCIFGVSFFIVYLVSLTFYRLYLHPLRKFPGPKLAAVTFWYEFYFDCVQRGQYVFKIEELHRRYGNVVRINPSELHFADPEFFNDIYCNAQKKRDKWDWMVNGLFINKSLFGTVSHDLHRERRAALNNLFSKAQVRKQQKDVQRCVDIMLERMRVAGQNREVIDLKVAFAAFTADVAMGFAYGRGDNKLSAPDFDPDFGRAVEKGLNSLALMNHLPWLGYSVLLARYAPERIIQKLRMTSFMELQRSIARQARQVLLDQEITAKSRPTVFQQIMASKLPDSEKTLPHLVQNGGLIVSAGTVSTAWALCVGVFYVLHQPTVLQKLQAELLEAIPDRSADIDIVQLEKLPYLAAVIQEALRLSVGGTHRSQRIAPNEITVYPDRDTGKTWSVPAGTPMSMSHLLLFRNERIFPDHERFDPERWLGKPGMDRYQFAFSKGTRNCIGINLAMAEMMLMLAGIFRSCQNSNGLKFQDYLTHIELFDTSVRDVETVGDGGVPFQHPESKGVRVMLS